MKLSRKILGFTLATIVFASQCTMAFAATDEHGNGDGTANGDAGKANILINDVNAVVVPTTLSVALNPKQYDVIVRYNVVPTSTTSAAAGTTYYKKNKTTKKYEVIKSSEVFADVRADSAYDGNIYTGEKAANDSNGKQPQVISLNYGIINKSTKAKIVKADFKISYTDNHAIGTKPIEFVDSIEKAQAYDATNNAGGAKLNELKMFMQVNTATKGGDIRVRSTYKRDVTYDAAEVYYVKNTSTGDPYVLVSSAAGNGTMTQTEFDALTEDTYVLSENASGVAVEPYTTGIQLSDAIMTASTATGSPQTFVEPTAGASETDTADAAVVYQLLDAEYANKDDAVVDINTTQTELQAGQYCKAVKGATGFTFTGIMNSNCDWSKANTSAITITPKYTIRDAQAGEADVIDDTSTGALNQVILTTAPSADAAQNILEAGKPADVVVTLGTGSRAATGIAGFVVKETGRDWYAEGGVTYANGKISIPASYVDFIRNDLTSKVFEITFNDAAGTKVEVTLGDKN